MQLKTLTLMALTAFLPTSSAKCETGTNHAINGNCHGATGNHACSRSGRVVCRSFTRQISITLLMLTYDLTVEMPQRQQMACCSSRELSPQRNDLLGLRMHPSPHTTGVRIDGDRRALCAYAPVCALLEEPKFQCDSLISIDFVTTIAILLQNRKTCNEILC